MYTRREFVQRSLVTTAGLCLGCVPNMLLSSPFSTYEEARYFRRLNGIIRCDLCFRACRIREGRRGFCNVRENINGNLYSVVYGRPAAVQLDPIEKEPMFHNQPGSRILCIGTASCNFRCQFCHNWHLTQRTPEQLRRHTQNLTPRDIVEEASRRGTGISFTYNEPTIFYEYMYDIARLARRRRLNTIFHTNGGMNAEPLRRLVRHMNAVTVDLKGFTADFYQDVSFADMEPVLSTVRLLRDEGVWFEIVNLIIPTLNDDLDRIRGMCQWIVRELGTDVPVHFTRFSPAYKMTHLPPTPVRTLERAHEIASEAGIRYVYIGNVPGHKYNSTYCPQCKERVIHRTHFTVHDMRVRNGRCEYCGYSIAGLWPS